MTFKDCVFDMLNLSGSTVFASYIQFEGITVNTHYITATNSVIQFNEVHITSLSANGTNPFAQLSSSTLQVTACVFLNFQSWEQNLVSMTSSNLTISSSQIANFNVTFISATSSSFSIYSSIIESGGLLLMDKSSKTKATAGFLDCIDCTQITLNNTYISNLSGTTGGLFSSVSVNIVTFITLSFSQFSLCSATNNGGVAYIVGAAIRIFSSEFDSNSAYRGGVFTFDCTDPQTCGAVLSANIYSYNTATEGAVVEWTGVRPSFQNSTAFNNKAVYGNFEASQAVSLSFLNQSMKYMSGKPGQAIPVPILIVPRDSIEQIVNTDNTTIMQISADNAKFLGTTVLSASRGVANFSALIIQGVPNSTISISVISDSLESFTFKYILEACELGELYSETGCYPCPDGTYTLNSTDTNCTTCPDYADCYGRANISLHPGYWRASNVSSYVYECPIEEACIDNSTCAEGYEDRLCSVCVKGFYRQGLFRCLQCGNLALRCLITALVLVSLTTLMTFLISSIPQEEAQSKAHVVTIKIIMNFFQTMVAFTCLQVDWSFIAGYLIDYSEVISSYAVSSLRLDCFFLDAESIHWNSTEYVKALTASLIPFVLCGCSCFISALKGWATHTKFGVKEMLGRFLILVTFAYPYIVKYTVLIVTCKPMENDQSWLMSDLSVQCWDWGHRKVVYLLFIPMSILMLLGIPALLLECYYIFLSSEQTELIQFYVTGFKTHSRYWELVLFFKKGSLIIVLATLAPTNQKIQVISGMLVLCIVLIAQVKVQPYLLAKHNMLETLSMSSQFIILSLSLFFFSDLQVRYEVKQAFGYMAICAFVGFLLLGLRLLILNAKDMSSAVQQSKQTQSEDPRPQVPNNSLDISLSQLHSRSVEVLREESHDGSSQFRFRASR